MLFSSGYFILAQFVGLSIDVLELIAYSITFFSCICIVSAIHYIVLAIFHRKTRVLNYFRFVASILFIFVSLYSVLQSQIFLAFGIG